jgi:hypothetical protein
MRSRWFGNDVVRNTAGIIKVTGLALFAALLCTGCSESEREGGGGGVKRIPT